MQDNNQKFVIFDLDGTLIDSNDCVFHCVNKALDEFNLNKFRKSDFDSSTPLHKILSATESILEINKIALKRFYGKFDSIQLNVCQKKSPNSRYYPQIITNSLTLLQYHVSLGHTIVILTNKAQRVANTIIDRLFNEYDIIVIGRTGFKGIKRDPISVLSRLKEHKLNISNCIAYYGDSVEDSILATNLGLNNFKLMHNCSDIQLKSFNDSELGIGLSYISALIRVFNHLSTSSITNPKYIFRGITQRFFTSSEVLSKEVKILKGGDKSKYPLCNELYKHHNHELCKLDENAFVKKLYKLISEHVKRLVNSDIIHNNGDADLYAKYIIGLINNSKYLFKILSPQYLRSGASVRLNNHASSHRQQDYLWYIRNLITEAQRLYPKEVKDKELDMLADLQHMGAGTCLLDFSRNFLVSLWFATQDFDKKDIQETGYLFCYDIVKDAILNDSIEITNKNSTFLNRIEEALNLTKKSVKYNGDSTYKFLVWTPDNINNRIIRQDSVFLFGIEPFKLSEHDVLVIPIPYVWKKPIQLALKSFFGVSSESLYADVAGYATSNDKLQSMSIRTAYFNEKFFLNSMNNAKMENFDLFQKGTGCLMKGEYEHALDYFMAFEAVNRPIIRDIENCKYYTSSGEQLSIQLNILCLELFYSKGICHKHIVGHTEMSINAYERTLALTKHLLISYNDCNNNVSKSLYTQNFLIGTVDFSQEDFNKYLSNKLYKILDSYIGLLIDVKYHNQAYDCIENITYILKEHHVKFSNALLLQTAQNEIVALAYLSHNTDALKTKKWKDVSSETVINIRMEYPFIALLNQFFRLLGGLCTEQDEGKYGEYYKSFQDEYNIIESNMFCHNMQNINQNYSLDPYFTAWDLNDIKFAINAFAFKKPKKRKVMLKMLGIVVEFQGLIEGHKTVEKY